MNNNHLGFLMLCAAISGAATSFLPVSWPMKICMYVGVGILCTASLVMLERFDKRLTEVLEK